MKLCLIAMWFMLLVVNGAAAQKKNVPPPPKPGDDGPSLEVTMKFIQDKLNGIGPVNFVTYYHDNIEGRDWALQWDVEVTRVAADARSCRIAFHRKAMGDNGVVTEDKDHGFAMKDVGQIAVMTMEQVKKEKATANRQPAWSFKIDPPVFALQVRKTDAKESDEFDFFDEQMANRVAKAMLHAVELCGGGSKPEPF
jgi:hypothetical protein